MQNLIRFINKYFHIFLFAILQIIAISFVIKNFSKAHSTFSKIENTLTYPFYSATNSITKYLYLEKENKNLIEQNLRLLNTKNDVIITYSTILDSTINNIAKREKVYAFTSATVIYNTTQKTHNYIIIDKGSKDGIEPDMSVFSPQGVVGIIIDVTENYAIVMSLLNANTKISAKLSSSQDMGIVEWECGTPYYACLLDIPIHSQVIKGDTVYTSGYSNSFPKDILIGVVDDILKNDNLSTFKIKVKLSVNFNTLNTVYIIKYKRKKEIDILLDKITYE